MVDRTIVLQSKLECLFQLNIDYQSVISTVVSVEVNISGHIPKLSSGPLCHITVRLLCVVSQID